MSTYGVDTYTVLVGQAVCGTLLCGPEGRKRFIDALKRCRGSAGYRNVLWFGFGVKHIAYELSATDQGATCAALCACLAECYSAEFTAEVLMEMTRAFKEADVTIPSLIQWHQLVKACAGLVANSTFPLRAEKLMRLVDDGQRHYYSTQGSAYKGEIAQTLVGLANLSRGRLSQMTIVGGADAGLIAAIADWLLDLDVEIRGGEEQNTRFRSRNHVNEPQLLILYDKNIKRESLQCVGRTYRLSNASQTIRRDDGWTKSAHLSGRVPWETALKDTFGKDFDDLMNMRQSFGTVIGSAARLYQGLYEADWNLPWEWLIGCRSYWRESFGREYVQFVAKRFPELETLRDDMNFAAKTLTVREAGINLDAQITSIAASCGCKGCCPKEPESSKHKEREFCLVYLAHAIMVISRALSGMITELCPMRSGLEEMYSKVISDSGKRPAVARDNMVEYPDSYWDSNQGTKIFLSRADVIFSGDRIHDLNYMKDWTCAMASNGLCYFFDILVDPASETQRAKVHVIPGRIEYNGRAYDKLGDIDQGTPPMLGGKEDMGFVDSSIEGLAKGYGGQLDVFVEERLDGLSVQYGLVKDLNGCIVFGPSRAVHMLCRNEGLVNCKGEGCFGTPEELRSGIMDSLLDDKAFCRMKFNEDKEEFLFVHGDSITRLAAVANTWDPVIQRVQCLSCCIRYAVDIGRKHITIIMGQHYITAMKYNEAKRKAAAQVNSIKGAVQ